jgi:hypothetical protein
LTNKSGGLGGTIEMPSSMMKIALELSVTPSLATETGGARIVIAPLTERTSA